MSITTLYDYCYSFILHSQINKERKRNLEESPIFASEMKLFQFWTFRLCWKQVVHVNNWNLKTMSFWRDEGHVFMVRLNVSLRNSTQILFSQLLNWWYQKWSSRRILGDIFHGLLFSRWQKFTLLFLPTLPCFSNGEVFYKQNLRKKKLFLLILNYKLTPMYFFRQNVEIQKKTDISTIDNSTYRGFISIIFLYI